MTVSQTKKAAGLVQSLQRDAVALFDGSKLSHMGRWCYGSSSHDDGPSGAKLWSALAEKKGGTSVLSGEEHLVLLFSLMRMSRKILKNVRSVCELGPGSTLATERKVFPLIGLSDELRAYTAVDFSEEFGAGAMETVGRKLGVKAEWRQSHVFASDWSAGMQASDLVLAFDMIGNMIAAPGTSPDAALVEFFRTARAGLNANGAFVASFNTEMDGARVVQSYQDDTNRNFCLGVVRRIARELPVSGMFDPAAWDYTPEWHADAGQCAHMLHPLRDQSFRIGGKTFGVKAGQKFHLSNSYRYTPLQIRNCAKAAGFAQVNVFQHGTAALLVAQNGASATAAPAVTLGN